MHHKYLVLIVKKRLKSVYICGSCCKIKTGTAFFGPPGISQVVVVIVDDDDVDDVDDDDDDDAATAGRN